MVDTKLSDRKIKKYSKGRGNRVQEIYIDRVKNLYSSFGSFNEELDWIKQNPIENVEEIFVEDYDFVWNEYNQKKRMYPHNLHIFTKDSIYHFKHFRSGYIGGGTHALQELFLFFAVSLEESFLAKHRSISIDFKQNQLLSDGKKYELDYQVDGEFLEIVSPFSITMGYHALETLADLIQNHGVDGRVLFERAIKQAKENVRRKGGDVQFILPDKKERREK